MSDFIKILSYRKSFFNSNKKHEAFFKKENFVFGAANETRTRTPLRARDFKSLVSAIPPRRLFCKIYYNKIGAALQVFYSKLPYYGNYAEKT